MKYEHVSEEYADELHDLAKTLVTPERFGGYIAVEQVIEEEPFQWEANIVIVKGEQDGQSDIEYQVLA